MKALYPIRGSRWIGQSLFWLGVILLFGIAASVWQARQIDRELRAELLAEAQRLVDTLNVRHVLALSGTEDDLERSEYWRLKQQLQSVREAFPHYRFIYLLARQPDGRVIVQIDSEPPGSEDESPPGDIYEEITVEELQVFNHHKPLTAGPTQDRWGIWVSALVPVKLPQGSPFEVALGIDIDAADWRRNVLHSAMLPTGSITFALALVTLIGLFLCHLRAQNDTLKAGQLRHIEPALVLTIGLILTIYLTYLVQTEALRGQARSFNLLAEAQTAAIGHRLRDLREFELEGVARFLQASDYVTVDEFADYTSFLMQNDLVGAWAWAPRVPGSMRTEFEQRAQDEGLADYRIWEQDADGNARIAPTRGHYFPFSRLVPAGSASAWRGFDLLSDLNLQPVVERVLNNGLASAAAPQPDLKISALGPEMWVMHRAVADAGLGLMPGVVVAALKFDQVLAPHVAERMLDMELLLIRPEKDPLLLAQSMLDPGELMHRRSITRPVWVFGETFLVRAAMNPAFLRAHPTRGGHRGAAVGLLLTIMLAITVTVVLRRRDSLERAAIAFARQESALALAESEARFRELAAEARSFRWEVDANGLYTNIDPLVSEILGYQPEELVGRKYFYDLTPADERAEVQRVGLQYVRTGQRHSGFQNRVVARDGRMVWVSTTMLPRLDAEGRVIGAAGSDTDITARKEAELQFQTLFQEMLEGFALHEIICDDQGHPVNYRYLAINPAFERLTGLRARAVVGRTVLDILPNTEAHWIDTFGKVALTGEPIDYENYSAEFDRYYDVRAFCPAPRQFACIFRDITAQKQHSQQLEYLAQHDLLTGLPNRALLADRLQQAMLQAERRNEFLGVAGVDLDAFKPINDHYGHEVGDRLLITLARRMRDALREGDTVARLGGDEFALVLVGLQDIEHCESLLQRVLDAVAEPVDEGGLILQVSVSLGVTFYPQSEAIDADQLLRQADQAMYQAKLAGKNRYHLFDADHDRRLRVSHQNVERVRQGLKAGEFLLHYQPKVDMRQGRVIGLEALIRWQHPERGLLSPNHFLPLLHKNRLMIELGDWVIEQVLDQISRWRAAAVELPVSLNVDPLQLAQPDFVEKLTQALDRWQGVRPGDLELEVLETSALDETVPMVDIIRAGKALGVAFSLDDFGTGYSSLSYLKHLPVATLKIDRSFVRDMLRDPDDLAILQGIISLSRTFRQDAIAEGVETEAHGEMLLQLGCRLGQGYAIARPMPAEDIPTWLAQWHPPASWSRIEALDAQRIPLLVAIVEYRAWGDHLHHFLASAESDFIALDQPGAELMEWLDRSGEPAATARNLRNLHQRLQSTADELLALVRSGARPQALAQFAELEAIVNALLNVLHEEMQRA